MIKKITALLYFNFVPFSRNSCTLFTRYSGMTAPQHPPCPLMFSHLPSDRHTTFYNSQLYYPFTATLPVCTDVELMIADCAFAYPLSRTFFCRNMYTSHPLNTCDRYFQVPWSRRRAYGPIALSGYIVRAIFVLFFLKNKTNITLKKLN